MDNVMGKLQQVIDDVYREMTAVCDLSDDEFCARAHSEIISRIPDEMRKNIENVSVSLSDPDPGFEIHVGLKWAFTRSSNN